jgi:hypothetical protein
MVPGGPPWWGSYPWTLAVKVTGCPILDGFDEELRLLELGDWLTVWVMGGEAEGT